MSHDEVIEKAIQDARRVYSAVADLRNEVAIQSGVSAADAYAMKLSVELFSLVMSSIISSGQGEEITEDTTEVHKMVHLETYKLIERILMERGVTFLKIDPDGDED